MIEVEDLVSLVRNYNPRCNAGLIRKAYAYGQKMHEGQYRRSGEPYFTHPVAVAAILTEQNLDDASIVTALLHDTIEDTKSTYSEVAALFGHDIAELVDGVTKLTNLQLNSTATRQAENIRKLFMAMSKDLRVILVKLADRLHNMRTIRAMPQAKQVQKARETMEIFAPLAGRMGMQTMREELEDLAFRVLNPEARNSIMRRFLTLSRGAPDVIAKITTDIRAELDKAGIEADVFGRAKKPYSVWRKMQEKRESFSRLSDIYGFRVITRSQPDCYRVLGVIHERWKAVPGRFKDYISQPKSNGYRSIHTTVARRDGQRIEVQIRTRQMHEVAESGVAAHWSYRDGVPAENPFAVDPVRWLSQLTEGFESDEDHRDFLEAVKLEMYQDQVFCFTPKGDVVKLPRGATPLDFAYAIHTRIGHSCAGARVDGIRVPLWTRLKNGQSVEIITAEGQTPQASWIDLVATGRAKSSIRRSLREENHERFVKLGWELVRPAFERVGRKASDKAMATAARLLGLPSGEELLARIGSTEVTTAEVLRRLYPDETPREDDVAPARAVLGLPADEAMAPAPCCQPVPGERIVGITYRGQGVMIHAIDCAVLADYESQPARWVDLRWAEGKHPPVHRTRIEVTIANDAGVLGRVCTLIGERKANISDLVFVDRKPDFFRLRFEVEVRDVEHLHSVMVALEADSDVAAVRRFRDPSRRPETQGEAAARAGLPRPGAQPAAE